MYLNFDEPSYPSCPTLVHEGKVLGVLGLPNEEVDLLAHARPPQGVRFPAL